MKHLVWLWVRILLLFALFVVVGLLPALSVIPSSAVPPLAAMQRSDGTISFKPVGGQSGSRTVIKKGGGGRDEFSCRQSMQGTHTCIHPRYEGEFAQIYWIAVHPRFGGSYKFAAHIVVNGEVVRDRSTAIEQLKETRVVVQYLWAPLAFAAFAACVFVMVVKKGTVSERRLT